MDKQSKYLEESFLDYEFEQNIYKYHKKNQNIKHEIPMYILYDLLSKNSEEIDSMQFCINKEFYKRSKLNNSLKVFLESLRHYYHISKQDYIDKCDNYKKFLTIIRQLCKYFQIEYKNKVTYFTSNYEKNYIVTYTPKQIQTMRYQLKSQNLFSSESCSSESYEDYKDISPLPSP